MNPAEETSLGSGETSVPSKIHYVIAYKTRKFDQDDLDRLVLEIERKKYRENFLHNLDVNGLNLQTITITRDENDDDGTETSDHYVLIETPLEVFFDIAERLKLKIPIAANDLKVKEKKLFDFFTPEEIRPESDKPYFTAIYNANLRDE